MVFEKQPEHSVIAGEIYELTREILAEIDYWESATRFAGRHSQTRYIRDLVENLGVRINTDIKSAGVKIESDPDKGERADMLVDDLKKLVGSELTSLPKLEIHFMKVAQEMRAIYAELENNPAASKRFSDQAGSRHPVDAEPAPQGTRQIFRQSQQQAWIFKRTKVVREEVNRKNDDGTFAASDFLASEIVDARIRHRMTSYQQRAQTSL